MSMRMSKCFPCDFVAMAETDFRYRPQISAKLLEKQDFVTLLPHVGGLTVNAMAVSCLTPPTAVTFLTG